MENKTNREIKFRAWSELQDKMITWEDLLRGDGIAGKMSEMFTDGTILMQYTGLKDKNGVEIYEGDILKREAGELMKGEQWREIIREVRWNNGSFIYADWKLGEFIADNEVEIIGNIHEHPHLLENN